MPVRKAICYLRNQGKACDGKNMDNNECGGTVNFTEDGDTVTVEYEFSSCGKAGEHGFHIHEKADFSNGCQSAGPHFNPSGKTHGGHDCEERHVGDMGNIVVDESGNSKGTLTLTKSGIKLEEGAEGIIGRSVMLHADPDDLGKGDNSKAGEAGPPQNGFVSKVTGNAGARIACGKIEAVAV